MDSEQELASLFFVPLFDGREKNCSICENPSSSLS